MPFDATVIRVMLSSPSDVREDCVAIEAAMASWNRRQGSRDKVVFVPWRWDIDATPLLEGSGQGVIDAQGVDDADVVIAVFWMRLGSSLPEAVSGTVAEIERARAQGKPVHVYFSQRAGGPSQIDTDQLQRLREFKSEIQRIGLTGEFTTEKELADQIQRDLTFDAATFNGRHKADYFEPHGLDRVYEEVAIAWSYLPAADGSDYFDATVTHLRRLVARSRTGLAKFSITLERDGNGAPPFRPEALPAYELDGTSREHQGVTSLRPPHKTSQMTFSQFIEFVPPLRDGEWAQFAYHGTVPAYKYATREQLVSTTSETKIGIRDWDFNSFTISYPIGSFSYSVFLSDELGAEPLGARVDRDGLIDSELTAEVQQGYSLDRIETPERTGWLMSLRATEPALKHSYRLTWRPRSAGR